VNGNQAKDDPRMRTSVTWLMAGVAGCWLAACAGGGGGGGGMGNMGGADPAEGGISEVPNPNPGMAAKSGKPLGQLQRGHETYMLKCAECHAYKLPQNIDVARWSGGALKRECGVDLGAADVRAVVDYVSAVKTQ
jgi:hypothetical protein